MAENQVIKSRREQQLERMRKSHPEKKFEDDEEIFGQVSDDYDEYEGKIKDYKGREEAFSNMFTSNPKSARLMMEWKDGKDPVASLIRIYGKDDILAAIEDPERLNDIEEANKEFAAKVAENDEYEAQYRKNMPESLKGIEEWAQKKGVKDDDIDKAVEYLSKICGDFILGKVTPETMELMLKALNYDEDMEAAEVAGRNAKITETLQKSKKGDGTKPLGSKNATARGQRKAPTMFDLAAEAM